MAVPVAIKKVLKEYVDEVETEKYKNALAIVKAVEDKKKQIADFCKKECGDKDEEYVLQFKSANKLVYKAEFKKTYAMRVVVPADEREKYLTQTPIMRATFSKFDPNKDIDTEDF